MLSKFDKIYYNVICESVQSSKLQKLINDITSKYKSDSYNVAQEMIIHLHDSIEDVIRELRGSALKTDKLFLTAVADKNNDMLKNIDEITKSVNDRMPIIDVFNKLIFNSIEDEYNVSPSPELLDEFLKKLDKAYNIHSYGLIPSSNNNKEFLNLFLSKIDAANVTDKDVVEVDNLNELNRKQRGKFSFVACFKDQMLKYAIVFDSDGTVSNIVNPYYYDEKSARFATAKKITLKKVNEECDRFVGVKIPESSRSKWSDRAFENYKYAHPQNDEEISKMNQFERRLKLDKIRAKRANENGFY